MKKILFVALTALAFTACETAPKEGEKTTETTVKTDSLQYFGEKITEDGALPVEQIATLLKDTTAAVAKLTGTVTAACQTKGCWMTLKNPQGDDLRITFKDYAFFVPKDCAGKTAIIDGIARIETTSVADLKEYAKDDKKSQAEIDAITEPGSEMVFEAKGVILK